MIPPMSKITEMIELMAVELSYTPGPECREGDIEHEETILNLPNRGPGRKENLGGEM